MEYKITEIDNIVIKNFKNFLEDDKPIIPIYQREFIEERINYFYNIIIKYIITKTVETLNKYPVPFLNMIYCCKYDNKIYILDGQHRYKAYYKYYNETKKDFNVVLNIKECITIDEIKEYFRELNNNYVLHNLILEDNDLEKAKEIKLYMKTKYNKHISNSENPRFPNINLDSLSNYILSRFNGISSNEMFEKMENLNIDIKNMLKEENIELYEQGRKKQDFYLAYLFTKSDLGIKRKKLPSSTRTNLWCLYNNTCMEGNCYVCNVPITLANFHAGHIKSVKNGGSDNINNLRPICSLCNLSMGTTDMEIFKQKYF